MAVKSLAQSSILQSTNVNSMLGIYESNYFHHLETVRLGGPASSISLTGLSQYSDYQHLQLRIVGGTSVDTNLRFRLNGDTGNNYAFHTFYGSGSGSPISGSLTSTNGAYIGYSKLTAVNGVQFGAVVDILDAFEVGKNKSFRSAYGNRHTSTDPLVMSNSSVWLNTAAINTILIYGEAGGNFLSGSRVSLYGFKVV